VEKGEESGEHLLDAALEGR